MKPLRVIKACALWVSLTQGATPFAGQEARLLYLPIVLLGPKEPVHSRTRIPAAGVFINYSAASGRFGPIDCEGRAELSVRGNTSFYFEKKSYRLELQTPDGEDNPVALLGMPADSDWVLYGSVTDSTFIRTVLAHELWRGMRHYAVRWRFVELFMVRPATNNATGPPEARFEISDQAKLVRALNRLLATDSRTNRLSQPLHPPESILPDCYLGTYVLLEKIKRGKHRVNIQKLQPEDHREPKITGGYILSKDKRDVGERGLIHHFKSQLCRRYLTSAGGRGRARHSVADSWGKSGSAPLTSAADRRRSPY